MSTGPEYVPLDIRVPVDRELAERVPDRIRADGILDIGTDPSYPPMEYLTLDGALTGADVDLALAIAATLDLEPVFTLEAFTALESGVRARRFEMGIAALSIAAGQQLATDATLYFTAGTRLVRPRGSQLSLDDLCDTTIATQEGSIQVDLLAEQSRLCQLASRPPVTVLAQETQEEVTESLLAGDVDGMLADSPVAQSAVRDHPDELELTGATYDPLPYGILTSDADSAFGVVVLETVNHLIAEGIYGEILASYGIEEGAVSEAILLQAGSSFLVTPQDATANP